MLKDPIKFLQEIVESNIENKFETANDIIMSYKIKTANVATFLTENITMHINRAIEGNYEKNLYLLCRIIISILKNNNIYIFQQTVKKI